MKKILLFAAVILAIGLASCGKSDYQVFVGTWGVERIDYYNIDFNGDPIPSTIETYRFTPGDEKNGMDLIFRDDRTGELRDHSRDTLYIPVYDDDHVAIDTNVIICPDTTLITRFTYSYHDDDAILYMNILGPRPYTYQMPIEQLTDKSFIYINNYDKDIVEKAWLVRLSNDTRSTRSSKPVRAPRKEGSLFGTIF